MSVRYQDNLVGGSVPATVNGTSTSKVEVYAPTSSGTAKQVAISSGSGSAPTWTDWSAIQPLYDVIHPVGEIVIGFSAPVVPTGITATWSDISSTYNNKALWIASGSTAGTSLTGLLPAITGKATSSRLGWGDTWTQSGALYMSKAATNAGGASEGTYNAYINIDASKCDKVYTGTAAGSSSYGLVRPTSVVVHVYKRTK